MEACFAALRRGEETLLGLAGLKNAVTMAGLTGDAISDLALKQILKRHAGGAGGEVSGRFGDAFANDFEAPVW